jgi:ABC-type nitrate/sulfonate/bicarbonate transport system substrate-binding protein
MLRLKTALATYGHTLPLKDGTVRPRGFEFEFEDVPVIIKAFRRMVRGLEFDVCELAMTTYLCARAYGKPFTAIPVFPMRAFHHGAILVNTEAGIATPKALEGRRVGVNRGYTVTTGLWARAILQHEYGVDLKKITWVLSGDEHVAEWTRPSNVISMDAGRTLEEMLAGGEIAAAIGLKDVSGPNIKSLIPNPTETGFEMLRRGLYPINHTIVVRNDVLAANRDLPKNLFDAFADAKRIYVDQLRSRVAEAGADKTYQRVMEITGDPLPYGIVPNRRALEAIVQHSVEQGILTHPFAIEDLFDANTVTLSA